MVGATLSGLAMSRVFYFLNFGSAFVARKLHMILSVWSFVLASAHFGLHWGMLSKKLQRYVKMEKIGLKAKRFLLLIFLIYGGYQLFNSQVFHRMFGVIDFTYFDYEEMIALFFLNYFAVFCLVAFLTRYLLSE